MLKEGTAAPDFSFFDAEGNEARLSEMGGKTVVVYFYPKDNTPGCTQEACGFRDIYDEILATGAVVVGVSPDHQDSHDRFRNKYNLPFYLATDTDNAIAKAYGAWGEKKSFGKTSVGILRSTFIVDSQGTIAKVFPKVRPAAHSQEVLDALK